jgi:hypothetical protein
VNDVGRVIVYALIGLVTLAVLIGVLAKVGERIDDHKRGDGKPRLPREPMTDMSPGLASFLSGRNVPAYTAKVEAITPAGISVRQARCCDRGHQSPKQAVTHAAAVKRRIETTGR